MRNASAGIALPFASRRPEALTVIFSALSLPVNSTSWKFSNSLRAASSAISRLSPQYGRSANTRSKLPVAETPSPSVAICRARSALRAGAGSEEKFQRLAKITSAPSVIRSSSVRASCGIRAENTPFRFGTAVVSLPFTLMRSSAEAGAVSSKPDASKRFIRTGTVPLRPSFSFGNSSGFWNWPGIGAKPENSGPRPSSLAVWL